MTKQLKMVKTFNPQDGRRFKKWKSKDVAVK